MSDMPIKEDTQPYVPHNPAMMRQTPPRKRGCGCWITGIVTLFVAAVLVGVGLFLPPINLYDRLFGVQYAMLDAQTNAVAAEGLTLIVNPADAGQNFGVALEPVTMAQMRANSNSASVQAANVAVAAAPPYLALQSPVYKIRTTGTNPSETTLSITVPASAGNPDLLDLYAWDEEAMSWAFVPSQYDGSGAMIASVDDVPGDVALFQSMVQDQPTVLVSVDVTQTLTPELGEVATIVAPGGLQPNVEGKLTGSLAAGFDLNSGYDVMPVIRNFVDPRAVDPDTVVGIIGNNALRQTHVEQIVAFASAGYDGVMIDYRDLPPESRQNFTAFIQALGKGLDEIGLSLGVVVPAADLVNGMWETGAYDWKAIGQVADLVQVDMPLDPSSFAPGADRLNEAMMRWAVGEVSRHKLITGLSAQSVQQVNGEYTPVTFEEALAGLGDVTVEAETSEVDTVEPGTEVRAHLDGMQAVPGRDEATQTSYIDYVDESGATVARVWLSTADALRFRMDRTQPFALRGVAFEDLAVEGLADGIFETIVNYKIQLPETPGLREFALRWRIEGVNGLVDEIVTNLNEELVATIDAPDGNYAINVEVVSGDAAVARSGAAVAVFAPTPTPTPEPTATPQPTAAPTRVAAAQPAQSSAPVANNAGAIVGGGFEYGGHVTSAATGASELMRSAGMNWMKVQIPYRLGMGADAASGQIQEAHARGFKILLGIVGSPGELAAGGDGYIQQYAAFVGSVAALGPDAIEVWNEPNLDREWPTGQISGAGYVNLLRAAHGAIKGANGGVMVITGAPAPTGAEAAFPGQVKNDDNWLREVVNAGGLNYADCVGAHYNEGIISPTQRGGDPRDGYYTRYFGGMLDVYWGIIGGARPLCFTELGFLTPEGFPPLPSYFGWAQNVTLGQQAAWLAEAAALSSQSGRVRIMIIWNIDFTRYDSDPMAGYAIIRPGGGCPACSALAAAR
jgi:hypothetical protein